MNNFEALSDFDFEQLMADLLSAEWGAEVEFFPRGKDGGVDLRVLGPTSKPLSLADGEELIAQCKHRPQASYRDIEPELKKEADRPIVADASRYVLVTSARLTRLNKQNIVTLFDGKLHERDIFGRDNIVRLLRKHPSVEKSHVKLWLSSGTVLPILLHQVEHLRSHALRDELMKLRRSFVETSFLRDALSVVRANGVCILVGPPGVGKTTTAQLLILRLMSEGWEAIAGRADVRELEAQITPGVNQVLFLDDFLGQNSLESKLRVGGDAELVQLIRAVEHDPTKIFLLTTREYILRQAQQNYEKLGDEVFNAAKVSVSSQGLSLDEKAHILYNQLFYSPLRAASAKSDPQSFFEVVKLRGFNPRLTARAISLMVRELGVAPSRLTLLDDGEPSAQSPTIAPSSEIDVPARLAEAIRNPADLWDHTIRNQLSPLQRDMLFVRATLGQAVVGLDDLYTGTVAYSTRDAAVPSRMELDSAVKVLNGDCFSLDNDGSRPDVLVGPLDPGMADATNAFLRKYDDIVSRLIQKSRFFRQVRWLAALLGVASGSKRRASDNPESGFVTQLADAAARTLMSPALGESHLSSPERSRLWLSTAGSNLTLIRKLVTSGGIAMPESCTAAIEKVVSDIARAPIAEIKQVIDFLESEIVPTDWRSLKTAVEHRTLEFYGDPNDLDEWQNLVEVLTFIQPALEFMNEVEVNFEIFASEKIEEYLEELEINPELFEAGDFSTLVSMADSLGLSIDTFEIDEKLEGRDELVEPQITQDRQVLNTPARPRGSSTIAPKDLFDFL